MKKLRLFLILLMAVGATGYSATRFYLPSSGTSPLNSQAISAQNGDRLVIETGIYYGSDHASNTTYLDDNASDLPEDETGTSNLNPWVSFSPTLTEASEADAPTVTTTAISKATHATASSGGNVTDDGGATITARGVCWNTSTLPTTANSKTTDAGTTGAFTSALTSLSPATTYHVRAYATNSAGTAYGSEVDFTTDTLSDISDAVFTVTETPTPVVTSLSEYRLHSGRAITITGTSFGTSTGYVRFIWNYATIVSWSATSIVCVVPPSVAAGSLYVGLPSEVWSNGIAYQVLGRAKIAVLMMILMRIR